MSEGDSKVKKPLNTAKKSVLPAQASAQDTSNWDDKAFSTPSGRDVIGNHIKREKSPFLSDPNYKPKKRQPRKVMYKPLPTCAEQKELDKKYNQKNVEPSSEQDT